MAFSTKIRKVRFVTHGYSATDMARAGAGLIDRAIVPRIQNGIGVNGSPAPPLSPGYAKAKARVAPPPIRNWTFTGRTLRSCKVLTAAPNRAVIGFTDAQTNQRAAINNRRFRQFGVSDSDRVVARREFEKLPSPIRAEEVK